jgi:hypothetical protein
VWTPAPGKNERRFFPGLPDGVVILTVNALAAQATHKGDALRKLLDAGKRLGEEAARIVAELAQQGLST